MTDFTTLTMPRDVFDSALYETWVDWCNANGYEIVEKQGVFSCRKTEPVALDYSQKRALAYPDIEEQLDMIYWDKVNNTNLWAEAISAVKEAYPKE